MTTFTTLVLCFSLVSADPGAGSQTDSGRVKAKSSIEIKVENPAPLVVPRGVDAIQHFTITNRRSQSIEILPAYGISLKLHRFQPTISEGDSADYAVLFKTLPHGGEVDRRLPLAIAGSSETIHWHRRFQVRRDVVCHPPRFSFGEVKHDAEARSICTLRCAVPAEWNVTSAKSRHSNVSVTAKETLREPMEKGLVRLDFEITAKLDRDKSSGPFDDIVVLHTTDKEMPEIWILCEGTVVAPDASHVPPPQAGETP